MVALFGRVNQNASTSSESARWTASVGPGSTDSFRGAHGAMFGGGSAESDNGIAIPGIPQMIDSNKVINEQPSGEEKSKVTEGR